MSTTLPEHFNFSPADWQLTDACETSFFLQGTADRLNTAMDGAALASKGGSKPEQLLADLHAVVSGERPDTGAAEPPTRDMVLQLISGITGVDQRELLGHWLARPAVGDKAFRDLQARAAMAGVELRAVEDDASRPLFVCVKWAITANFSNLNEVSAWLDRVDGGRS